MEGPKKSVIVVLSNARTLALLSEDAVCEIIQFCAPTEEKAPKTSIKLRKLARIANPDAPKKIAIAFCETSPTAKRKTPAIPV